MNRPLALLLCVLAAPIRSSAEDAAIVADLSARVTTHGFPSIFEAWSPAENMNRAPAAAIPLASMETPMETLARHDLIFLDPSAIGLVWNDARHPGMSTGFTPESVAKARAFKARLSALNPKAVLLVEIRHHDARSAAFPEDSPWWKRDRSGNRVAKRAGTALDGYFMLDLSQPGLQERVATLCAAAIETGAVDGCMMDWWEDTPGLVATARRFRDRVGDRGLLMGNVNGRIPVRSAPYLNGIFMEGFGASFFPDWRTAVKNLQWAASHLRPPAFSAFEAWYPNAAPPSGTTRRNDLARMRMVTALSLCNCDGYVLYADPFPFPGHPHDWYPFWRPTLGAPVEPGGRIDPDGSYRRNFRHGSVVFNPPDNREVVAAFSAPVVRQSTGDAGIRFSVPPGDGEIFVRR